MSEKSLSAVLTCELDNGYILKNFFSFASVKGRPVVTFTPDKIIAPNRTADDQLYASISANGDELSLTWDENIPMKDRSLSLTFDATNIQTTFGRIRKKEQAKMIIAQIRSNSDPFNFNGANSSNEFSIYVSSGSGGDGRECLRSIAASRTRPDDTLIRCPDARTASLLVIPARSFRQMVDSYSKCKKETIKIKYYPNMMNYNGQDYKTKPGMMMTTDSNGRAGPIIEKYGVVPDDEDYRPKEEAPVHLKIDESAIVRANGQSQVMIEVKKANEPTEFVFAADKIATFAKLASMHNEGNVRIMYQDGCHLKISYRYGAFGEAEIYLSNSHLTGA